MGWSPYPHSTLMWVRAAEISIGAGSWTEGSELHKYPDLSQTGFALCHTMMWPHRANPTASNGLSPLCSQRMDETHGSYSCDKVLHVWEGSLLPSWSTPATPAHSWCFFQHSKMIFAPFISYTESYFIIWLTCASLTSIERQEILWITAMSFSIPEDLVLSWRHTRFWENGGCLKFTKAEHFLPDWWMQSLCLPFPAPPGLLFLMLWF